MEPSWEKQKKKLKCWWHRWWHENWVMQQGLSSQPQLFYVAWTGRSGAVSDLSTRLCGDESCLTTRRFPHPSLKRKHKCGWFIFTEFYFIMLQTMTSRYIDTQLLLCVYVHLWVYVYVCVKRAVRPQKAEWKSREGALNGLTRQR